MKRSTAAALIVLLALGGCGGGAANVGGKASPSFAVEPDHAKVFFYAAYGNREDRPLFDSTFRLHIDTGYVEEIDDSQFIEKSVVPGDHVFDVDEISWTGANISHSQLKAHVPSGQAFFVAEDILPDGKAVLSGIEPARGMGDISARTKQCLCTTMWERLLN